MLLFLNACKQTFHLPENLEVDGCLSKENLFGQSMLWINAFYIVFPNLTYKFME